ncbi:MAG: DNA-processing protein DprA [Candidatus Latescibacteria bacterium]|nr:DNA-processing protein DprA [Candidatus Latescibacterota bacterium]
MNDPACVLALRQDAGIGPVTFWRLLRRFGSVETVLAASLADLQEVSGVSLNRARRISESANAIPAVRARIALFAQKGIRLITAFDPAYPARLRRLPDAPPLLYAQGDLVLGDRPCVAVVGAHQASEAGIIAATAWAEALARRGIAVISGLAAGIDAAGHRGALKAGGLTVAVVGAGLDRITPRQNLPLARQIAGTGALLSEYPPATPTSVSRLLARNRIVVGLSDLVLVVEARLNAGGAMDAARRGMNAGIPVCAIRDPDAFPANERLLSLGAHPVSHLPAPDALLPFLP